MPPKTTAELRSDAITLAMHIRKYCLETSISVSPRPADASFADLPTESQNKWLRIAVMAMSQLRGEGMAYASSDLTPLIVTVLLGDRP